MVPLTFWTREFFAEWGGRAAVLCCPVHGRMIGSIFGLYAHDASSSHCPVMIIKISSESATCPPEAKSTQCLGFVVFLKCVFLSFDNFGNFLVIFSSNNASAMFPLVSLFCVSDGLCIVLSTRSGSLMLFSKFPILLSLYAFSPEYFLQTYFPLH